MDDENDKVTSGGSPNGRPDLRVVGSPYFSNDQLDDLEIPSKPLFSLEDHLIENHISEPMVDETPPEYAIEPIPYEVAESEPISGLAPDVVKEQIIQAAERLASYNIARIAFEFQEGKHGFLVDPKLVSKVRLENQMNNFQRLMRFLKEGPKLKKELSKEEILSGLIKNGSPLTKAPTRFTLIEGIHFTPKDGMIGLSGVTLYPANNGGVFDPNQEQSEGSKAILQSMEESIEALKLSSEVYKAAEESSSGFMSAIYLLGKADDVKRAYEKYAGAAQRMAQFRAEQIAAGVDTRHMDSVIDEKNLMTPALIKNKTSGWKNFAKSFVQYGSLVERMIDAASRPEHQKPKLESELPLAREENNELPATQSVTKAEVDITVKDIAAPKEDLEKVHLLGLDYYVKKDSRFIEMAKTNVGITPPPGHKFAHPEIPLLWALFRDAYPDKFGNSSGKLASDDPRSAIAEFIESEIPHFLYIDDRLPDIKDPIERIESYINTLKASISSSSFSPLTPAQSVLGNQKIIGMLKSAGVVRSSMMDSPKYQAESSRLGLKNTCPYVFDVNSKFHNINLSKYTPPEGKKLVHPLMPLLVEYHKTRVEMLIRESGIKKPGKDFLRQIGAVDAEGNTIDFNKMLFIDKESGGAGSAYQVYSEFLGNAKNMSSSEAAKALPQTYEDDFFLGLPDEIKFKMGVVKNLEADFFDSRDRSAKALSEIQAVISETPRTNVFNLAFSNQVINGRKNLQNQTEGNRKFAESPSKSASAKGVRP